MKKFIYSVCAISVLLSGVSCGNSESSTSKQNGKSYTAENIIKYFEENNAPDLGEYTIRTEEDDQLLGRPGYYTSKVSFRINSVEYNEADPYDGSIQVYETVGDAQKDYDTYEALFESLPLAAEYITICDRTIVRMKFDVVPSTETVYEQLLSDFFNE